MAKLGWTFGRKSKKQDNSISFDLSHLSFGDIILTDGKGSTWTVCYGDEDEPETARISFGWFRDVLDFCRRFSYYSVSGELDRQYDTGGEETPVKNASFTFTVRCPIGPPT